MPEIGEIARIVNRLRTHLVGKTIASVTALDDAIVYKDTTHEAFKKALEGKKVLAAKQWGKYFWLVMDSPPHPLMHFGMTGWIYIKNDPASHYRSTTVEPTWPPKYLKFNLHLKGITNEIAFADPRRLARIRLIHHPDGHDLRNISPLDKNGPDPVLEPIELAWLTEKLRSRRVPVKAWLLDQSAIAGVGNWVGDEILYQARLHPECYSNKLTDAQIKELHRALLYVTKFAVDVEADTAKFPKDWLMLHRWGKGKKVNKLPTGEKIEFVNVGSRTSAFVPSLQKKGPGKEKGGDDKSEVEEVKLKKAVRRVKRKVAKEEDGAESEVEGVKLKKAVGRVKRNAATKEDEDIKKEEEDVKLVEQKEVEEEDEKLERKWRKLDTDTKASRGRPKKPWNF